jgi:hypothetical protein
MTKREEIKRDKLFGKYFYKEFKLSRAARYALRDSVYQQLQYKIWCKYPETVPPYIKWEKNNNDV